MGVPMRVYASAHLQPISAPDVALPGLMRQLRQVEKSQVMVKLHMVDGGLMMKQDETTHLKHIFRDLFLPNCPKSWED